MLALRLQNVQNDRDSVLIVVAYYALIRVRSVRLDHAALLLGSFGRLMIFQEQCLWVQHWRVLAKEESLDFDELDVCIL